MDNPHAQPSITDLMREVAAFRDARDWSQFHTPKDLASAIAIEAAELLELFLWQDADAQARTLVHRAEDVAFEIADILIGRTIVGRAGLSGSGEE